MSHKLRYLTHRISDAVKAMDPVLISPAYAFFHGSQQSYVIRHAVHYAIGGKLTCHDVEDISTDYVEYGGWKMFELFFNIGDALQC